MSPTLRPLSRISAVLLPALAFGLVLPAAASAEWVKSTELETGVGVSGLVVDAAGNRLVTTRSTTKAGVTNSRLLGITAEAEPEAIRTVKGVLPEPVPFGKDGLLFGRTASLGTVTRTVPNGKGGTKRVSLTRYRLGVSVGQAATAALGTQRSQGTAVLDEPVRVAGTTSGNAAMAWSDVGEDGVVRVHAAWRDARSKDKQVRLGTPQMISGSGSSRLLGLATGPGGRTVVVYQTGASDSTRRLYTRSIDVQKGKLGPVQTLRRGGPGFSSVTISIGSKGRAVIAWGEQDSASERTKPYVVRATTRDSVRARFATPKPIDKGGSLVRPPGGALVSAVDAQNRVTVAWNQTVGSVADGTAHDIPRVAEAEATGGLSAARDIAAAGRVHGIAVAGGAAGATGLVLVREQERPLGGSNADRGTAVQVAIRPSTGPLGGPETVSQFSDTQLLDRANAYGSAAIGGLPSGAFTAAWTRATVNAGKLVATTYFSDQVVAPAAAE